jgi:hypothetical protein
MSDHYGMRPADYTTAGATGQPARPDAISNPPYRWHRTVELPYIVGEARVREIAREISDDLIATARNCPGPVVFVTGNSYVPAFRSFTKAEYVWNADSNRDGEQFAYLVELVEDALSAASVALEAPEYDNALYVVDLNRWQYREDAEGDDLDDEWEPVDNLAVDDNAENPRE